VAIVVAGSLSEPDSFSLGCARRLRAVVGGARSRTEAEELDGEIRLVPLGCSILADVLGPSRVRTRGRVPVAVDGDRP